MNVGRIERMTTAGPQAIFDGQSPSMANESANGKPTPNGATTGSEWPKALAPEAFHGLAGEIVRTLEPGTEADPAGILVQVLVCFGNIVGHAPHFTVESDRHALNLDVVLVGETSKGRKGTSYGRCRSLYETADADWAQKRTRSGLSSGEGLIWHVRDAIMGRNPVREGGRITHYEEIEADPGEADKRLLVYESEFALVLRVMERDGNSLSAIIRQAWDSGTLQTLTTGRKSAPVQATGAHVSILGHITKMELLRYLDSTEAGNGFANRFLWLCVSRSKCLPDDEDRKVDTQELAHLRHKLADALRWAKSVGEMRKDQDARADWRTVYPVLSEGKPGMLGAVTSRAEAQTMRLACVYALLDKSEMIRREHLRAALAVWTYCEESAAYIFGDSLGDPVADEILRAVREVRGGLTRTDISNLLGRHRSASRLDRALDALRQAGRVRSQSEQTEGRKAERWFVT